MTDIPPSLCTLPCARIERGNWAYFAGVGHDPKHRHFRSVSQALRYDPDGSYVRKWVPQLAQLDILPQQRSSSSSNSSSTSSHCHDDQKYDDTTTYSSNNQSKSMEALFRPWDFPDLVPDWPSPIVVDVNTQYTFADLERLKSQGTLLCQNQQQ
jgi:hypothetical protein